MKSFLASLLFCVLFATVASASHIVGGDMGIAHQSGSSYKIYLNLYFDVLNGSAGANDDNVLVSIFKTNGNIHMTNVNLPKVKTLPVNYTNPACSNAILQTEQIVYEAMFNLDPALYSDAGGYYVSWQRCCRNEVVNNIFNPGETGMVFYAEFPPVFLNNAIFRNSSPVFNPVKGDYLCTSQVYSNSFAATDPDGDQLVYSLVTPLQGTSTPQQISPAAVPRPYSLVDWRPGFSATTAVPAAGPGFTLNTSTGLLSVNPGASGLFVFSVKCEEYRAGKKIGEVRRDFQWLVDNCDFNEPPELSVLLPDGSTYLQGDTLIVTGAENACFDVSGLDLVNSTLTFKINPLNFTSPILSFNPVAVKITEEGVPAKSEFCWPDCSINRELPYIFEVEVFDEGCPLPKSKKLRVTLLVKPKPNAAPIISTTLPNAVINLMIGDSVQFDVIGFDADNDLIFLSMNGNGANITAAGMIFDNASGTGSVSSAYFWKPDCDDLKLQQPVKLTFRLDDNSCFSQNFDTTTVYINLNDIDNREEDFIPANVFTPNNDGINDVFSFPTLPADNCEAEFRKLSVYNRWGKKVFETSSRSESWDGGNVPDGVYYYLITFSNKTYKGPVTKLK